MSRALERAQLLIADIGFEPSFYDCTDCPIIITLLCRLSCADWWVSNLMKLNPLKTAFVSLELLMRMMRMSGFVTYSTTAKAC
jgi:hypothetical protein